MIPHPDLIEALTEKNKLRDRTKPLVTLLLLSEYSSEELKSDIEKLDFRTIERIEARLSNALFYIKKQSEKNAKQDWEDQSRPKSPVKFYTIEEVSKITKLSTSHIRNLIDNNLIPYTDFAGKDSKYKKPRISENDLEHLIKHKE